MTTNAQPATPNGRGRKRPLTETTAPLASSLPATAGPPDLSYFSPASAPPGAANMYASDSVTAPMLPPSQEDLYRHQATASPQANNTMYDPNNQLARVPRASQLVRMPTSFNAMAAPTIPSPMMPGPMPLNMNIMNVPGVMGGPHAQYNQQMVGNADELDGNLVAKIQSMKKKRANIPPFVLKLSRYAAPRPPRFPHSIPIGRVI